MESGTADKHTDGGRRSVSIVIPVFNEESGLNLLKDRLDQTITNWPQRDWHFDVEILIVNDGSTDQSKEIITEFARADSRYKAIHLSRNFGHQEAISAGLACAGGDCAIIMDADLQDPPELLEQFIECWLQGNHIVYGIRKNRKENFLKKMCYNLFYRILKKMANTDIPLDSGDFCLMDRKVIDTINALPEKIRFVRGLRSWAGFSHLGIEYDRAERQFGSPKYTFRKLLRLAFNGFFGFSTVPLRIATAVGFIFMCLGFFLAVTMAIFYIGDISFLNRAPSEVAGFTSLFSGVMLFFGFQLLILGIIGEYIGLLYFEVKSRPTYVIAERIGNFKHPQTADYPVTSFSTCTSIQPK